MARHEAHATLGERIEETRKSQGRTAVWLADQANISTSSYWRLIANPDSFRFAHIKSIADALNVPVLELVGD